MSHSEVFPIIEQKPFGTQLIIEFYDCSQTILNDTKAINTIMLNAAKAANATVVNHCFHKFSPHGVSGVVVIAESHITVHTWPESGYCAVDIFTCGNLIDDNLALEVLKAGFESQSEKIFRIERGLKNRLCNFLSLVNESSQH